MVSRILEPPLFKKIERETPLFFLAGPIQGADNWQIDVINNLEEDEQPFSLVIANPRRSTLGEEFVYREQTRWEREHLKRAACFGAVIFWLAKKNPDLPYKQGRPYGQTTRFEFGSLYGCSWNSDPVIRLGIEEGYEGSEKYYRDVADEIGLVVHTNLRSLCLDATQSVIKRYS